VVLLRAYYCRFIVVTLCRVDILIGILLIGILLTGILIGISIL
jgi:hypothetical protein